ncbi:MAG: rhomboid family intramembrane serine protease, partial [Blastocatellia bacterium]
MLLPISDENPVGRSTPYVNYTLIAINIFVFILEQLYGEEFVATYSTIPYEITHGAFTHAHTVHGLGVIPPGPQPIYITLLTSMFMHAG